MDHQRALMMNYLSMVLELISIEEYYANRAKYVQWRKDNEEV